MSRYCPLIECVTVSLPSSLSRSWLGLVRRPRSRDIGGARDLVDLVYVRRRAALLSGGRTEL